MLFKNLNVFIHHTKKNYLNKYVHKYVYNMNKAYMRRTEGSETFDLSFQYVNPVFNIDRQFNFTRKLSENIETLLTRITVNVEKILNKKMKKKKNEQESFIGQNIKLYQNGNDANHEMTCEELFKIGGDIRLKLIDQEYKIVINTPWIKSVSLPSCIMANYFAYPNQFQTMFVDHNLTEYTWYKSVDQQDWVEAGTEFIHTSTNEDIDKFLKLHILPKNKTDVGPIAELISESKIQAGPGNCPFEIRHQFTQEKLNNREFRIVTYNLLADLYADSEFSKSVLFPYCPEYALKMDYRKQLVLKELIGYNADIICLQEVDEKIFMNDLQPVLSNFNFEGTFEKKGNTVREGLACFFDKNRFKLIESKQIVLSEELENPIFKQLNDKIITNENLIKRIKERTTSLKVIILKSIDTSEYFIIGNTHLYFHPDADHIRLIQGAMCIIYLKSLLDTIEREYSTRSSLIFCGDFNSTPDCGTYRLYTTGICTSDVIDWQSNKEEAIEGIELEQNLIMSSGCGTPKYTNFTAGFKDCLDYIYYQKDNFEVTQVIPLPSEEELNANIAIPSIVFPSDHLSLVVDLKLL